MIILKTKAEIEKMKEGGKRLADICASLLEKIKPGVTGLEIDNLAQVLIKKNNSLPSFKTVGHYGYAICICTNDIIVHGVPTNIPFKEGDLVGLDIGLIYNGFHSDMSWSIGVGNIDQKLTTFLKTGKNALQKALQIAQAGNHIGDISRAIEEEIKKQGYLPVKALVGHGIGRSLHEDPQIPCFTRGDIKNTPEIKEGMTLAVEVIYNAGIHQVVYKNDDGWTISTQDGLLSGLFEQTIAITEKGMIVLTGSEKFAKMTKLNA